MTKKNWLLSPISFLPFSVGSVLVNVSRLEKKKKRRILFWYLRHDVLWNSEFNLENILLYTFLRLLPKKKYENLIMCYKKCDEQKENKKCFLWKTFISTYKYAYTISYFVFVSVCVWIFIWKNGALARLMLVANYIILFSQ